MIKTSNYNNCHTDKYQVYSISRDKGKDANYVGDYFLTLAPKREFFKTWRHNRGLIDEVTNNEYYMKEFYEQVLKPLNPKQIYEQLDNSILLCYEEHNEFCHRHIVAAWFELTLGVDVKEVNINDSIEVELDRPEYIKEYLNKLMMNDNKTIEKQMIKKL